MWVHNINPEIISLGPIAIKWYGVAYIIGFIQAWYLCRYRFKFFGFNTKLADELFVYAAWGVILGGRLGYVIFYDLSKYLHEPLRIFMVWEGGMAFHGGMLGVIVAVMIFSWRYQVDMFETFDALAPCIPLGIFCGRIANFINGELWGRVTDVPWAVYFPMAGFEPRHPSQLYQALTEGLLLFVLLWLLARKKHRPLVVSGFFLFGYGILRFITEFWREPDPHIGFEFMNIFTRGQIFCMPMILFGLVLMLALLPQQRMR